MADHTHNSTPGFFGRIGAGITRLRNFVLNSIFLVILVLIAAGLLSTCEGVNVPKDSALLVNPKGIIVESAALPDPLAGLIGASAQMAEVELNSILRAIDTAATDNDIRMYY